MWNLFRFIGFRHLTQRPGRTLLTTLGICFGVALYVAITLINRSTLSSFKENVASVAGKAKLSVVGDSSGFSEALLESIENTEGVAHAVPMIETTAYFAGTQSKAVPETLVVLGVDLLKEQAVRTYKTTDGQGGEQVIDDPLIFLNQPDSIIITHAFAKQHSLKLDSKIRLATVTGSQVFTVRGMLSPEGPAQAYGGNLAIMDIDGARVSFGKLNKIDRVDLVLNEEVEVNAVAQALRTKLGPSVNVERTESQSEGLERMVKSFQVLMSFFSSIALIVALFLVSNSVSIAVAERKKEIGTLRALGAEKKSILVLFLTEAIAMGLLGSLGGVFLGKLFGEVLLNTVTQGMTAQFLIKIQINSIDFGVGIVIEAVAIGTLTSIVAALWPSFSATQVAPILAMKKIESSLNSQKKDLFQKWAFVVGTILFAIVFLLHLTKLDQSVTWVATFIPPLAMGGAILMGPSIVFLGLRLLKRWTSRFSWRLAQDNLLRAPKRTSSNVMSLMVGLIFVIMTAAINLSFRNTILSWLNQTMHADLLISSSGRIMSAQVQPIHESIGAELSQIEGVRVDKNGIGAFGLNIHHFSIDGTKHILKAFDPPPSWLNYTWLPIISANSSEQAVLGNKLFETYNEPLGLENLPPWIAVSENMQIRKKLAIGQLLELQTPTGNQVFRIAGVVSDFASANGVIYMDRRWYKKFWQDPLVSVFGVYGLPGTTLGDLRHAITKKMGSDRNLMTLSNLEAKEEMSKIIDQTFAYSHAIEWAALLVGLLGLLNTLLISVMERTREIGMLRAIGMERAQVQKMILSEALIQGFFGALVAVFFGSFLAEFWIKYSLTYTLGYVVKFYFPWLSVVTTLALGIGVALVAGLYPSRKASHLQIVEALEYE